MPAAERIIQAGEVRSVRLESLRALAAGGVLVSHSYALTHGYGTTGLMHRVMLGGLFGVFLFFALTGYLMFWPFVRRDFGDRASVSTGRYFRNRAVRILPLYYVVLAALMLMFERGGTPSQWWHFLTFSQNFSRSTAGTIDGPMWSLVVEVQFYLALPLIAVLVRRVSRRRKGVAAALLCVAAIVSCVLQRTAHPPLYIWSFSIATTFVFFVAGQLLALLRLWWEESRPNIRGLLGQSDTWSVAAFALWLIVVLHYDWPLMAFASFLLLGACVLPLHSGIVLRALEWKPLAAVGLASYSLYLWHYPVLTWLAGFSVTHQAHGVLLFMSALALIPLAMASYAVVEAPSLRLRRRWSPAAASTVGEHRPPLAL